MAITQCRAKDPTSCRVHGAGGQMQFLQEQADHYAQTRNVAAYMAIRADMDKLTDEDTDEKSFEGLVAPDTGNLIAENWMDSKGEIISEAPNDMLLSNLSQSSVNPMPYTERIKEILKGRGYSEEDLFITKHFHFKKDESGWKNSREVTKMEAIRAGREIEKKHGVEIDPHDRDIEIEKYFHFVISDTVVHKERCKEFIEGYDYFVQSYK